MGQYHLTVNLDRKEFLMPHKLGVGLKLREQTGFGNSIPDALFMLLAASNGYGSGDFQDNQNHIIGRWAGDRVAVIGDYAQPTDLPMPFEADKIYKLCHTYTTGGAAVTLGNTTDCQEYECTSDGASHYLDITDMVLPVMMMNDPTFYVDVNSPGWRSRKVEVGSLGGTDFDIAEGINL